MSATEFELKFQLPPEREDALRAALARGETRTRRLRARYFDTPGEALAAGRLPGGTHAAAVPAPGRGPLRRGIEGPAG